MKIYSILGCFFFGLFVLNPVAQQFNSLQSIGNLSLKDSHINGFYENRSYQSFPPSVVEDNPKKGVKVNIIKEQITTFFWQYFSFKFSLGLNLNQLDNTDILPNYLTDVTDSLFSVDSLFAFNEIDSLIPNRANVVQDFDVIQISIPVRFSIYFKTNSWLELVTSFSYNTLKIVVFDNTAILVRNKPNHFIDSSLTLVGEVESSKFTFNANYFLLGTGFRLNIPRKIIYIGTEKKPMFFQFEFLWNLGNSKLNLEKDFIRDARFFSQVGYTISLGTYVTQWWDWLGVEGVMSLTSLTFRSSQSLEDLVFVQKHRSYFSKNQWSWNTLGVEFFFYYDPVL